MAKLSDLQRIVVTGMGLVAPGAANVPMFAAKLRAGESGIKFWPEAADLGMGCQVAGMPDVRGELLDDLLPPPRRRVLNPIMEYAALAAIECWKDAGLFFDDQMNTEADWDTGVTVGTGIGSIDVLTMTVGPLVAQRQYRRLGSRIVEKMMASGPAAALSGIFGLGGPAVSVNSACSSATSAIHRAVQTLRLGLCKRQLAGGVELLSLHTAAAFDSMRVVCPHFNAQPERASRPLSASAGGFVPAGGAGFLLLETLESARSRGARIHAELAGSYENCGGQRGGGSMTLPSSEGAVRCVTGAFADGRTLPDEIDYVNAHLTGTIGDAKEVSNLARSLGRDLRQMPWINATKSLIGHTLGAAGAIESIATILQIQGGFLHPSLNCEDLLPELAELVSRIPASTISKQVDTALKTSFGFGDVNACLVIRRWDEHV